MKVCFSMNNSNQKEMFDLSNTPITLGRTSKSKVVLQDGLCSQIHCQLSIAGNKIFVQDLESKNGIYINNVKVSEGNIYFGDELKVGETILKLVPEKCSADISTHLEFKGNKINRMESEIQIETIPSAVRSQNIAKIKLDEKSTANAKAKLRNDPLYRDSITLSEAKNLNKNETSKIKIGLAKLADVILLLAVFIIPFLLIPTLIDHPQLAKALSLDPIILQDKKTIISACLSLLVSVIFYRWNRSRLVGTVGESIMGIADKD